MELELTSLNPDQLIALYHQINTELRKHLIDGASWEEQQERINSLTEISKELTKRKIELRDDDTLTETKK